MTLQADNFSPYINCSFKTAFNLLSESDIRSFSGEFELDKASFIGYIICDNSVKVYTDSVHVFVCNFAEKSFQKKTPFTDIYWP